MTRISGITPSGHVQLGNYLGAIREWARHGATDDLYFLSDLHALTTPHNPARLRALAKEQLAVLIAAGVDPDSVFVQSDLVREHGALTWVLECVCSYGEAARMIQFKEKSASQSGSDGVRLGLLTYPVLMAADILLHGADEVPVGADQSQHVELARVLARRFNASYGETFVLPTAVTPTAAARVRDLADPTRKMAKSAGNSAGVLFVRDSPDLIRRKVRRAVTDTATDISYDPHLRPGVANLLDILAACRDTNPYSAASGVTGYADLKEQVADAVIDTLRPIRERTDELLSDPAELDRIRATGAKRAQERAEPRLRRALELVGLA